MPEHHVRDDLLDTAKVAQLFAKLHPLVDMLDLGDKINKKKFL